MNVEEVKRRLVDIERSKSSFERAHAMQDALYRDVLRAFAEGGSLLALTALEAEEIHFDRHTA